MFDQLGSTACSLGYAQAFSGESALRTAHAGPRSTTAMSGEARFVIRSSERRKAVTPGRSGRNQRFIICHICLIGPFTVSNNEGADLTPRSKKSRALLAMLAMSPRGSRSRVWLRDKLWSDRGEDQASASLRQTLFDIRRSLGKIADEILVADYHTVTLKIGRVRVDALELLDPSHPAWVGRETSEWSATEHFLEGIDVKDPEFEDWLKFERQLWRTRLEDAGYCKGQGATGELPEKGGVRATFYPATSWLGPDRKGDQNPCEERRAKSRPTGSSDDEPAGWCVALLPPQVASIGNQVVPEVAHINSMIGLALLESGVIRVVDLSASGSAFSEPGGLGTVPIPGDLPVAIQARVTCDQTRASVHIVMLNSSDRRMVWTGECVADRQAMELGDSSHIHQLLNRLIEAAIGFFLRSGQQDQSQQGPRLVAAVTKMFRLSRDDLSEAETSLRELVKTSPSTQAYAWLAFLMTFRVGQRFSIDDAQVIEEAQHYASHALETGRDNSLSLALVGHVHSYLFGEFDFAAGLFEQALRINPSQALGWDLYAMLHCYAGKPKKGLALANWARHLGDASPHQYYFDVTRCISAAMAANYPAAIEAGNAALLVRPDFNSILRFLVSSYAQIGNLDAARMHLRKLERVEPQFTIGSLLDAQYPGLDTAGGKRFIEGLRKAGVQPK